MRSIGKSPLCVKGRAPRHLVLVPLRPRLVPWEEGILDLTPNDIEDRKISIRGPKSGKEMEVVFIPKKVADRPKEYIRGKGIKPDERIFLITHSAPQGGTVIKTGKLVGIELRPHDLRRHAATFASRAGTPLEIVSNPTLF